MANSSSSKVVLEDNKKTSDLALRYMNEKKPTLPNYNNNVGVSDKDHTTTLLDNERGNRNMPLAVAEDDLLDEDPTGPAPLLEGPSNTLPRPAVIKPARGNGESKLDLDKETMDADQDHVIAPVHTDELYGASYLELRNRDDDRDESSKDLEKVDWYQRKKLIAQGMMDLALFSANANQLRYVLDSNHKEHPYYYFSLVLISLSISLQVAVGVAMALHSQCDVSDARQKEKAHRANDATVLGVFLITVLNVFISSFSVSTNH